MVDVSKMNLLNKSGAVKTFSPSFTSREIYNNDEYRPDEFVRTHVEYEEEKNNSLPHLVLYSAVGLAAGAALVALACTGKGGKGLFRGIFDFVTFSKFTPEAKEAKRLRKLANAENKAAKNAAKARTGQILQNAAAPSGTTPPKVKKAPTSPTAPQEPKAHSKIRGFFGAIGGRIGHCYRLSTDGLYRAECRLAKTELKPAQLEGLDKSALSVDSNISRGVPQKPAQSVNKPEVSPDPKLNTGRQALLEQLKAKQLAELDKQGIELINNVDKPLQQKLRSTESNFEENWQKELPERLAKLNDDIDNQILNCVVSNKDVYFPPHFVFHDEKGFIDYAQARANVNGYKLTEMNIDEAGGVRFKVAEYAEKSAETVVAEGTKTPISSTTPPQPIMPNKGAAGTTPSQPHIELPVKPNTSSASESHVAVEKPVVTLVAKTADQINELGYKYVDTIKNQIKAEYRGMREFKELPDADFNAQFESWWTTDKGPFGAGNVRNSRNELYQTEAKNDLVWCFEELKGKGGDFRRRFYDKEGATEFIQLAQALAQDLGVGVPSHVPYLGKRFKLTNIGKTKDGLIGFDMEEIAGKTPLPVPKQPGETTPPLGKSSTGDVPPEKPHMEDDGKFEPLYDDVTPASKTTGADNVADEAAQAAVQAERVSRVQGIMNGIEEAADKGIKAKKIRLSAEYAYAKDELSFLRGYAFVRGYDFALPKNMDGYVEYSWKKLNFVEKALLARTFKIQAKEKGIAFLNSEGITDKQALAAELKKYDKDVDDAIEAGGRNFSGIVDVIAFRDYITNRALLQGKEVISESPAEGQLVFRVKDLVQRA